MWGKNRKEKENDRIENSREKVSEQKFHLFSRSFFLENGFDVTCTKYLRLSFGK